MSKNNIGPKRLVVGAHYGLKEWIIQRVTAIVMVVFTIVLLIVYLLNGNPSYDGWAGLFANPLMKVLTLLALLSLFYHAGLVCVIFGWITSSPLAFAWAYKLLPFYGSSAVLRMPFRSYGKCKK